VKPCASVKDQYYGLSYTGDEMTAAPWAPFFSCHIFSPRGKMGLALMFSNAWNIGAGTPRVVMSAA